MLSKPIRLQLSHYFIRNSKSKTQNTLKETPQTVFQNRLEKFQSRQQLIKKKASTYSWLRIGSFILYLIGFVYLADRGHAEVMVYISLAFVVLYLYLLKKHEGLKRELRLLDNLVDINSDELSRMRFEFSHLDDGAIFFEPNHPYHIDLDIFGRHSLYQLINRTSSVYGSKTLAGWLSTHATSKTINNRQVAIQELAPAIDLRQQFQAEGLSEKLPEAAQVQQLINWLNTEQQRSNFGLYKVLLPVLATATLASIVVSAAGLVPIGLPALLIFVNIAVLGTVFRQLLDITRQTENGYRSLRSLKEQIALIESHSFNSPLLSQLKHDLTGNNQRASKTLRELSNILDNLQNRSNLLYLLFNLTLLLDIYWYLKISRWKKENKANLESWFSIIGEFDALMSMAAFGYANPDYCFPVLSKEACTIKATDLGHPLINPGKRVSNNFEFTGRGGICLITGSNMSGKSTFLRTVGLNSVLALAGAPVCAKAMEIGELKVFTSMRTQDDLEESVSSFYAELKRLKQLLGQIDDDRPTLFMIDEVLKGTNSDDRHRGATALIKQLNRQNAFGFVSTHDIVLGNMTNELQGVKNYSFNSTISGNQIHFDYRLTPGICKSFNATKLMQLMGIEVDA
ncbi:MutS-related protein [Roseivirga thermotolerans]|uniref:MutS-related protein n=1 Tax=Roseivirga thermotolerans TaxID=1758176 RepID=UPI00273E48D6|nr:hypothetical protein [Roseivirga thermotolerans]